MIKTVKIPKLTLSEIHKFTSRFKETEQCWIWHGGFRRRGYGCFSIKGHTYSSHRISYELFNDTEIPEQMTIDHLCKNPSCVNPKHLEVVTITENVKRSPHIKKRAFCRNKHFYTEDNTRLVMVKGKYQQRCKICAKGKWKKAWAKESGKSA